MRKPKLWFWSCFIPLNYTDVTDSKHVAYFGTKFEKTLHWRHNERNDVSNHQRLDYLLTYLFRRRSKKISKLRVTGLFEGNLPVTGYTPAQRVSNAENVSIWWRHHIFYNWKQSDNLYSGNKYVSPFTMSHYKRHIKIQCKQNTRSIYIYIYRRIHRNKH